MRFNRRRDACLPAKFLQVSFFDTCRVSIADATLASPQLDHEVLAVILASFNRRRDACLPATKKGVTPPRASAAFQSQTRRLPPRNRAGRRATRPHPYSFNRRRDACLPATQLCRGRRVEGGQ